MPPARNTMFSWINQVSDEIWTRTKDPVEVIEEHDKLECSMHVLCVFNINAVKLIE